MPETDWLGGVVPNPPPLAAPRQGTAVRHPADAPDLPRQAEPPTTAQRSEPSPAEPPPDPRPEPEPEQKRNFLAVAAHFFGMATEDRSDRKARGNGKWWFMRWMAEQPASVEAHLRYYLDERFERRDGRKGWDLDTASPLLNELFALAYRAYGLTVGLVFGCLWPYASGWVHQRPGRAIPALALRGLVWWNVVSWLLATVGKS